MRKRSAPVREIAAGFEPVPRGMTTTAKSVVPIELWTFAILGLLIFLVYLPGIAIPYFGDDLGWVDAITSPWRHFVEVNTDGWYRPLQASLYALAQKHFGMSTIPIHVSMFLIHALLCLLVVKTMTELGYGGISSVLAGVFMAVSQANAFALLSNDTLSQVAGTFFGCLSLCAFASPRLRSTSSDRIAGAYFLSVAAFAVALLFKETTSSFLPLVICLIVLMNFRRTHILASVAISGLQAFPYIGVFLVYLGIRMLIGANSPSFGTGGYNFNLGSNVFLNLALDISALVIPVSSVDVFEAFASRNLMMLALIASASIVLVTAICYGLWLRRRDLRLAAVFLFLIGSAFPMVLMNHVSELYVYNMTPFFSILAGVGIGAILEPAKGRSYAEFAVGACVMVFLACHVAAIREKSFLMQQNGARAAALLDSVGPYIDRVPHGGALFLVNPPAAQPEYAVYLMNGFNVLQFAEPYIKKLHGREDIDLSIIGQNELPNALQRRDAVVLGLDGGNIKVIVKPRGM